jgi:hypothetical protein
VTPFASVSDPHYRKMLSVIRDARAAQLAEPRIDMPGADVAGEGIVEGRSRQMLPPQLPEPLPEVRVRADENGFVRLGWEASARMVGLAAEVWRGPAAGFPLERAALLGRTERPGYCDTNPPPGEAHYAVVFVSDPAAGCGACEAGGLPGAAAGGGARCPLSSAAPLRSEPVRVSVTVPERPPTRSTAAAGALHRPVFRAE